MPIIENALTLHRLAENFCIRIDEFKNRSEIQKELNILTARIHQLNILVIWAESLFEIISLFEMKRITHSVPKRKLSARIKNLEILIDKYNKDRKVLLKPQILDDEKYKETFIEIETLLKDTWKKFTTYDKRADSLLAIEYGDASVTPKITALRNLIGEIKSVSTKLPPDGVTIDSVQDMKDAIVEKCDQLQSEGLDEEVSKFLSAVRVSGFPLKKLIESPKIIEWLQQQDRAVSFIVKRNI